MELSAFWSDEMGRMAYFRRVITLAVIGYSYPKLEMYLLISHRVSLHFLNKIFVLLFVCYMYSLMRRRVNDIGRGYFILNITFFYQLAIIFLPHLLSTEILVKTLLSNPYFFLGLGLSANLLSGFFAFYLLFASSAEVEMPPLRGKFP
jgi:hypothetical protein